MGNLDKFFPANVPATAHPRLRSWGPLIKDPNIKTECEVFRKHDGFSYSPPKLYIHWTQLPSETSKTDQEDWDDTLNAYLVENGVKAVSAENEAIRFALMLRRLFQPLEVRYGEGYFNAVVVQVASSSFGRIEPLAGVLEKIGERHPHEGRVYQDAVRQIEDAITQCAVALTTQLEYERPQAETILVAAVTNYLSERFSLDSLWMK